MKYNNKDMRDACIRLMKRGMTVGEIIDHYRGYGFSEKQTKQFKKKVLKWKEEHQVEIPERHRERLLPG